MMKHNNIFLFFIVLCFFSCQDKAKKGVIKETRTSGTLTMLVDESFSGIVDKEIEVFRGDYPDTKIKLVKGNEGKIVPAFLNDSIRVIVLSRALTPDEEKFYHDRKIPINTDRFGVDGIALITSKDNIDSNITVQEVIDILKGSSSSGKSLVFDNAYSSTLRYFKELAKVKTLPKTGVFTLQTNDDVIKYIGEHKNYIGVVGVNWLLDNNVSMTGELSKIMLMNVKNLPGKKGSDAYYKPIQDNLINGIYPFLRNILIINAEGRDGLGTGFATWLTSERGQLIVLRSGLGPDKLNSREINLKSK